VTVRSFGAPVEGSYAHWKGSFCAAGTLKCVTFTPPKGSFGSARVIVGSPTPSTSQSRVQGTAVPVLSVQLLPVAGTSPKYWIATPAWYSTG
jgi:hypothetical protein